MHHLFLKKRWLICAVIVGLQLLAGAIAVLWCRQEPQQEWSIENAADCAQLLLTRGIAVQQPPITVQQITLPVCVNAAYEAYLSLQDRQRLPLREHAGERAQLYVYEDASADGGFVTLIVCDGRLIAADQTSFGISSQPEPLF